MCGRYTYLPGEFSDLRLTWNVEEIFGLKPQYNIAPSQEAPVIVQADAKLKIELFRWGLIPSWAQDPAVGKKMINARAETLGEKPAFKNLLGTRRCLVWPTGRCSYAAPTLQGISRPGYLNQIRRQRKRQWR